MPLYDFRCEMCSQDLEDIFQPIAQTTRTIPCPLCGGFARKIITFPAVRVAMPEHYNMAVGAYVRNEHEFRDHLKAKSEAVNQKTGMNVDYQPVDVRDPASVGATDEGLDATRRAEVAIGKREAKRYV